MKREKREFLVRAFGLRDTPILRCRYLTTDLPGIVENYWKIELQADKKRTIARAVRQWERANIEPDIITRGQNKLERELDQAIGPQTFEERFPRWSIDEMAAYIERALPFAFEVALELLFEEARVCACHNDPPDQDDFDELVFTFREYLKHRTGMRRNTKPRKRTPDLAVEAHTLYRPRLARVQAADKDHTKHKNSAAWSKHVTLEDKRRPGKPKIPLDLISQLPFKSPREIALEWTAEELNRRHANLGATSHTVRSLLKTAVKAESANDK